MDHVEPISMWNICDSTRRKWMPVSFVMAISEIFTKKVTRLLEGMKSDDLIWILGF